MRKLLTMFSIAFILASCTSDNEEDTFSNNNNTGGNGGSTTNCDTTNISFSKVIMPMIQNNCLSCHASTSPQLSSYDKIAANATRMLGAIKHQPGYKAMPPNGKLPDCSIAQFEAWVKQGKKNN